MNAARKPAPDVDRHIEGGPLRKCVSDALDKYLKTLDGHQCTDLFRMVLAEVEAPLLERILHHAQGNQSKAAEMLGINRGTLRKKLKAYSLIQ